MVRLSWKLRTSRLDMLGRQSVHYHAKSGNVVFTLFKGVLDADRAPQSFLCRSGVARGINSEKVLTKVLNGMWIFEVVPVAGQVKQDLVIDCDMTIFECLGARFEQLDVS